ncbi:hypothetical protein KYT24_004391 [Salmonella enterica]|nr:hypothetical protein [Salmonella enterica]
MKTITAGAALALTLALSGAAHANYFDDLDADKAVKTANAEYDQMIASTDFICSSSENKQVCRAGIAIIAARAAGRASSAALCGAGKPPEDYTLADCESAAQFSRRVFADKTQAMKALEGMK